MYTRIHPNLCSNQEYDIATEAHEAKCNEYQKDKNELFEHFIRVFLRISLSIIPECHHTVPNYVKKYRDYHGNEAIPSYEIERCLLPHIEWHESRSIICIWLWSFPLPSRSIWNLFTTLILAIFLRLCSGILIVFLCKNWR